MKRTIAMLLCLFMGITPLSVFAEGNYPYPFDLPAPTPAPESEIEESIQLELHDEVLNLKFDSSPEYSSAEAGLVQASFFAYAADGITLYELYIIFPDTVQAGMVITPDYAALTNEESSVVLIESNNLDEIYYFASLMDGGVYPAGSTFSIAIETVEESEDSLAYSGSLSAHLVALDMSSGEQRADLDISNAPFRFTLNSASHEPRHSNPLPSNTPEDMRRT